MVGKSTTKVTPTLMSYRPQLDSLRCLAVVLVLLWHLWGGLGPFGGLEGVRLFFVLSGFLITGILLDSRSDLLLSGYNRWDAIRQFYIRRSLRIFPAYYL